MAGERTFVVKFISDTAGFNKGIKKVSDDVNGIGGQLKKIVPSFRTLAIAGTAAFGAIAATSIKLVNMASDLEESQSKVNTVFGASAQVVTDFAKTSAVSFGITKQAALEAAGTFGNLIQAFGIGRGQAAEMSTTLLALAADLASFNNTPIEQAIEALRSGLSGEAEPLKRFGIAINDVRLKQEALNLGLYDGKGALDITAKTQASYALILKDTSLAQGDFARTSGGFANQMRILQATFSDAATEIGVVLLPYFTRFVTMINDNVMPAVRRIATVLGEKGLVGAFQQLVFESGNAGPKVVSVFKAITVGAAEAINILAKAFFITSATFKVTTRDFVGAAKDFYKATQNFIDVGSVSKQFDSVAKGINNYAVRGIPSAIRAQQSLGSSTNDLIGDDLGGLKGVTKTVKTAKEKLEEYTDALQKSTSAQRSFTKAQKDTVSARTDVATANTNLAKAQSDLSRAIAGYGADSIEAKKAQVILEKAQRDVERAGYGVEESVFAVADAEKALAEVRADPESTPQAIREAEINLAEAKLATKDAIDSQTEATDELATSQSTLNELINGAIEGSDFYTQFSDALTEAKKRQTDAEDKLADAISAEAEAQERLNDANEKAAELAAKYPKIAATVNQPGAIGGGGIVDDLFSYTNPGGTNSFGLTEAQVQANIAGLDWSGINFTPFADGGIVKNPMLGLVGEAGAEAIIPLSKLGNMGNNINITVNAGLGASGVEVGREIEQYLREYSGFTGRNLQFGSVGAL